MKKNNYFIAFAILSLILSSCTSEENLELNQPASKLKSYQVKRDLNGAYSLSMDLNDNVKVDKVLNSDKNLNQYFLYTTDYKSESNINDAFQIDNTQVKLGFIDENSNQNQFVTIKDDNISLASKSNSILFLKDYQLTKEEDGSFSLDFKVQKNIKVSFVYNDNLNTYEIHLEKSKGGETSFSRSFNQAEGESLEIHFVNHVSNAQAKTEALIRKPVIIIDDGEDA